MESKVRMLPYGPHGDIYKLNMKFSIAFVIGDTEMYDKLCGRFNNRTSHIKSICRHCNCQTKNLVNLQKVHAAIQYCPSDMKPEIEEDPESHGHNHDYFKNISHYPIDNAFHHLYFGANGRNIHLATPGELLHMH